MNADLVLALADVDLVYVRLSALLCAADRVLPDEPGSEGLYVYALTEPGLPRCFTVLGRRLRNLPIDDVAAIIERREPPEFTTDAVRQQHDIITRLTSRLPVVLPARFGSVTDEPSLRALVSRHRLEILAAFEQARGCAQMTVRVFGPGDRIHEASRPAA